MHDHPRGGLLPEEVSAVLLGEPPCRCREIEEHWRELVVTAQGKFLRWERRKPLPGIPREWYPAVREARDKKRQRHQRRAHREHTIEASLCLRITRQLTRAFLALSGQELRVRPFYSEHPSIWVSHFDDILQVGVQLEAYLELRREAGLGERRLEPLLFRRRGGILAVVLGRTAKGEVTICTRTPTKEAGYGRLPDMPYIAREGYLEEAET